MVGDRIQSPPTAFAWNAIAGEFFEAIFMGTKMQGWKNLKEVRSGSECRLNFHSLAAKRGNGEVVRGKLRVLFACLRTHG